MGWTELVDYWSVTLLRRLMLQSTTNSMLLFIYSVSVSHNLYIWQKDVIEVNSVTELVTLTI